MDIDIETARTSAYDCKEYLDQVLVRLEEIANATRHPSSPSDKAMLGDFVEACLRIYHAQNEATARGVAEPVSYERKYAFPASILAGSSFPVTSTAPEVKRASCLTAKEREVLQRIVEGKTSREVGKQLSISERTVKFHLRNIYSKLNVINRSQAVAMAMRMQMS